MIIEDSHEDVYAIKRILEKHHFRNSVSFFESGDDAFDYLADPNIGQTKPVPTLIILDLNLPGTDGREILELLRSSPATRAIPVVVSTTSSNPRDITYCYEQGVQGYLVKPVDFERLQHALMTVITYWFGIMTLPFQYLS
jgi:CheY-like chemotaxis protein